MPRAGRSWNGTLTFTNGKYVFPAGVRLLDMRCAAAGDIRVVRYGGTILGLHPVENDVFIADDDWKEITAFGTTAALEGKVYFRGVYVKDV
jgi:hypothetical protein